LQKYFGVAGVQVGERCEYLFWCVAQTTDTGIALLAQPAPEVAGSVAMIHGKTLG
jgi:hypothetical protein